MLATICTLVEIMITRGQLRAEGEAKSPSSKVKKVTGVKKASPRKAKQRTKKDEDATVVPVVRARKSLVKRSGTELATPRVVTGISHEMLQDTKDFASRLQSCKVTELKDLCHANYLMAKGVKSEIIDRLALAHFHGCPGRCPSCLHSKLEYVYSPRDDIIPKKVECHVRHEHSAHAPLYQ